MAIINTIKDALGEYKDKKVFLTGHTGFKGTWLTRILKKLGANVTGYSLNPITSPNHFDEINAEQGINSIIGDIRDNKSLNNALSNVGPDYVFHLAAQALVKRSFEDPIETFSTNIIGSVNLLNAVKNCDSVRSLVYITSDKCYENYEWDWGYRENDTLGGYDPYSASKASAEIVYSAYCRSYFHDRINFGSASVRAGNVIGGGDWSADRIIPDCIRAVENNKKIILRNPNSTRPWQHVLEPLSGYLLLGAKLYNEPKRFSGSWNFGPLSTEKRNVYQVANAIIRHLGRGEVEKSIKDSKFHEAGLLQLNCDRANQLLDWYPRWDIDKTLEMTGNWYNEFLKGSDIKQITDKQILDYFPEIRQI
ncbi:CDP-glucose 4,6-dehydratase [bacterium]|nr:CDP-glucose 4,6-dehydratase [bacterium]